MEEIVGLIGRLNKGSQNTEFVEGFVEITGKEVLNEILLDLLKRAKGCFDRGTTLSSSGVQFSEGLKGRVLIRAWIQIVELEFNHKLQKIREYSYRDNRCY